MSERYFVVLGFYWTRKEAKEVAAKLRDKYFKRFRESELCKEISDDEILEVINDRVFICKEEDIQ